VNYRSITHLSRLVSRSLGRVPPGIEAIVGIPRSGMLLADMLGLHLSLPVMTLGALHALRSPEVGARLHMSPDDRSEFLRSPRKLLVVDDSCGTGGAMKAAKRLLQEVKQLSGIQHDYTFMVAYANKHGLPWIDICLEELEKPRCFEWNWVSNVMLTTACIDIDGVICRDPTIKECDEVANDGKLYRKFLQNVPLLRKMRQPLGTLVTCRLEHWRADTMTWLASHGVRYKKLVMMPFKTVAGRKKYGHARYKAEKYKQHGGPIFIESSSNQARGIFQMSKRPVLCTDSMELLK
jgi:uncharacterized HAD superfamily protein/hypoxanthine phosphoribosyltransferase